MARVLEAHGIATTSISLVREHTEKIKPPRALFVPFPFGHALGRPNDPALQHRVLAAALDLLTAPVGPVLADFPEAAEPGDETPGPVQASTVVTAAGVPGDTVAEMKDILHAHAQWLATYDGRTTFGLSGVPAERFGEVLAFLQRFAASGEGEVSGRPAGVSLPAFIRWAADDLKSLYYERRLLERPQAPGAEIARWFWGETAAGQILRDVRDRLDASEDPRWKAAAFGVAR
ncbi:MAG TPA: hypothetical protein VFW70_22845 [Methylomirabilota bacterium]|nr:hypothetical protein [Methylomirabilota bacterium]